MDTTRSFDTQDGYHEPSGSWRCDVCGEWHGAHEAPVEHVVDQLVCRICDLVGIIPASLGLGIDAELGAIVLVVDTHEFEAELLLSSLSAIDLLLKLMATIDRLQREQRRRAH